MRLLTKILLWLTSVAFMAAITSCDAVTEYPSGPCPTGETVALSFKMITDNPLQGDTRADGLHPEQDSEYRQFEDGINVSDLGLFIFAKDSEGVDQLVMKVTNIAGSTNPAMMITGSPGAYTVTMIIEKNALTEVLGYEIDANSTADVEFRLMILANCRSAIAGGWDAINGKTFPAVVAQAQNILFPMDAIHSGNLGDSEVTGVYKGNIPMYGTNTFTVSQNDLFLSRPDERIWLGEIDMLRSLAKVRVIDNIQNRDAVTGYPKIIAAEIISSQTDAIPVPYDAVNYSNGNQVHTANLAVPEKVLSLDGAPVYKLGTIPTGWNQTPETARTGTTRVGYIPEQRIANINGNVAQGMPVFRITAALKQNPDGTDDTKTYDVPMTGYNINNGGFAFSFGDYILRNHIYSLSVNRVAVGAPAEITVNVAPWTQTSLDLDYTQTVTVQQKMNWVTTSYASDEGGGVYLMKPWETINGHQTWMPIVGTFGISTPVGARWDAFLITLEGDEDAFTFVNTDGGPLAPSEVWGLIDGKTTTTLRIATTDNEPEQVNKAMLQVVVTIGTGAEAAVMEADITPEGTSYKNFILVQNPL